MIIQTRDIDILKFINKFGYVNSVHIQKNFDLSQQRASQILIRFLKNNYLVKEQILAKEPTIYYLTSKGAELIKANKIKPISLQNLKHNLLVTDVYIDLKKKSPGLEILSDREQRAGKFGKMANRAVPDLLILTDEQAGKKNIAIEIELSRKNKQRLDKILAKHSREYLETHYYCNSSTFEYLEREAKLKSNVKVYNYFEYEEIPPEIEQALAEIKPATGQAGVVASKDLELKAIRLENLLKAKDKELNIAKNKLDRIKKVFEDLRFKKATFGNSYSLSGEELERIKKIIKGC